MSKPGSRKQLAASSPKDDPADAPLTRGKAEELPPAVAAAKDGVFPGVPLS